MVEGAVRQRIAAEIAAIPNLSRAELMARWSAIHGRPPPRGISRRLLEHAVAWELQSKGHGGLTPALRRRLRRKPDTGRTQPPRRPPASKRPALGSRLVREWGGRIYRVDVVDGGFVCDGTRYGSLSAVARAITGARWSGPRFFGL